MNDDLESKLREAFKPVAPRRSLRSQVMATLQSQAEQKAHRPRGLQRYAAWLTIGLAASVVGGVGWSWHMRQERELAEQLEARRQVIEALRVTNQKLDLAFMTVRDQSS